MNLIKDNLSFNFKFILTLFLFVTLLYSVLFYLINIKILSIISFLGLFIYAISIKSIDENNYDRAFLLSHLHIVISAVLATIILGWDYGFYLIIIAIASTTYLNIFKKRIITYLLAGFDFIIFVFVYLISNVYFPKSAGDFAQIFYLSNLGFLLFLFVIIFKIYSIVNQINIKDLHKHKHELKAASQTDHLTGLINKRALNTILAKKSNKKITMAMCDIDNFKSINDKFGHNIGDEVLKTLAKIFTENTNKSDIVCRWGGEEFVIVATNTSRTNFINQIQNIRFIINQTPVKVSSDQSIHFTVTFGISDSGTDPNKLTEQADKRLYKGKHSVKNCIITK
ncbi:GGDEF domain-containing protein [Campylobacter sp.]|uniref:GGDEF domain-containing protein n=1 Tax=Campylobacter sp. TaxID=205 RepID=UPI00259CD759|nr:GGDEF domain-containing protein [Campylobacter sp.]MBQ7135544.1 GGDEF domain-containing protein [Campylobacter sp.]MBQ8819571.1 GGDEF domain-containing protein [Campylobacter sp.]